MIVRTFAEWYTVVSALLWRAIPVFKYRYTYWPHSDPITKEEIFNRFQKFCGDFTCLAERIIIQSQDLTDNPGFVTTIRQEVSNLLTSLIIISFLGGEEVPPDNHQAYLELREALEQLESGTWNHIRGSQNGD